jgi:hypothetical protein
MLARKMSTIVLMLEKQCSKIISMLGGENLAK